MIKFIKGNKERFAPEHELELLKSWGWQPVDETPSAVVKPTVRKATVTADPAVVSAKEDATDNLIKGEEDDSDSWK